MSVKAHGPVHWLADMSCISKDLGACESSIDDPTFDDEQRLSACGCLCIVRTTLLQSTQLWHILRLNPLKTRIESTNAILNPIKHIVPRHRSDSHERRLSSPPTTRSHIARRTSEQHVYNHYEISGLD